MTNQYQILQQGGQCFPQVRERKLLFYLFEIGIYTRWDNWQHIVRYPDSTFDLYVSVAAGVKSIDEALDIIRCYQQRLITEDERKVWQSANIEVVSDVYPETKTSTRVESLDFLNGIQYQLLKEQKQSLLIAIEQAIEEGIANDLTGILHLIDSLQDAAVKSGIPESIVYSKTEDDEE